MELQPKYKGRVDFMSFVFEPDIWIQYLDCIKRCTKKLKRMKTLEEDRKSMIKSFLEKNIIIHIN